MTNLRAHGCALLGLALGLMQSAIAYERSTHQRVTNLAVSRSVLADPAASPLSTLGVTDPSKDTYRTSAIGGNPQYVTAFALAGWGARFEDGTGLERVRHHFMDPQQNGMGLVMPLIVGRPSASWILEDQDDIPEQEFSLRDTEQFYWLALSSATKQLRDSNLVLLLEGIGRGVHHLQDMSQPAHTRNDAHPYGLDGDWYEQITNAKFVDRGEIIPSELVYGTNAVDLHEFNTARKFWVNAGKGIAEFTSENFVSQDTNFRGSPPAVNVDALHPLPAPGPRSSLSLAELGIPGMQWIPVYFYGTTVHDKYSGATFSNPRASALGLFSWGFSQNKSTYEQNYRILFPRAIAYSAGLINYFFRGRLQVESFNLGDTQASVTVKNVSAAEFALKDAAAANTAEFVLFYEATDGQRKSIALADGDLAGAVLAHNDMRTFSFNTPADLDRTQERPIVIAFRGIIGNEPGIAAAAFGTAQATFLVTPNYVPADGIAGARVINWNGNRWALGAQTGAVAGAADWRSNDGEVLTWGTRARARYFEPTAGPVFREGAQLTVGPLGSVSGVSTRIVDGQKLLNIAVISGQTLSIYSRVYATSYSDEALWSTTNPLGWRQVYSGTHGSAFTHFFFNSSGTEGQYITKHAEGGPDQRVKVVLNGFAAQASTFPAYATVTETKRVNEHKAPKIQILAGTCVVTSTNADGELHPTPGGDSCVGYDNTEVQGTTTTTTWEYVGKTVLCVDYRADIEVFCTLEGRVESPSLSTWTHATAVNYFDAYYVGQVCANERTMMKLTETRTSVVNSLRKLRVGNKEIPWSGGSSLGGSVLQYSGDDFHGDGYVGSSTSESSINSFSTSLIYADARTDALVYEQQSTRSSTHTLAPIDKKTSGGYIHFTEKVETVTDTRVVSALGGADIALFSDKKDSATERTYSAAAGTYGALWIGCAESGFNRDQSPVVTTSRDALAKANHLSAMAPLGSYAIAPNNYYAASQQIQITGNADKPQKNLLTNGDLIALLPGSPPAAGYHYDVKVIR